MLALAGHHDLQALLRKGPRRLLGFFNMGAGCIQHSPALSFGFFIYGRSHPVGPDHNRCRAGLRQLVHHADSLRLQFCNHLRVVNQRTQRHHRRTGLARRRCGEFHRPPDAVTEPHVLRRQYFHSRLH
jgi:hypothetical protein